MKSIGLRVAGAAMFLAAAGLTACSFDDGPGVYTGQILDILAANDVKATFFVIAREDESY